MINHRVIVSCNTERQLRVSFDAYQAACSEFTSSSYTVKREEAEPMVAGGSGHCIVRVAEAEVGTYETGENYTKYGEWYGLDGQPWCVMFIIWCAYFSNVSETVIPRECEANRFIDLFTESQIKLGGAYGGVERPQPGDIYFRGTGINDLEHVGIITEVYTDHFVIVDGNNGNKVGTDEVAWKAPNFYAYVRPDYATTDHTTGSWHYDSSEHWHVCENCNFRVDEAYHSLGSWQIDTEEHWKKCTGCNVTFNWGSHTYGSWGYNTTRHWKACTSCGYKINNSTHTATGGWLYDSSQHWKTCSVCGGKANVASHAYTAGYCSTCRYNPNISIDNIPGMERSPK